MGTFTKKQYDRSFELLYKYEHIVVRRASNDTKALDELVAICDTDAKFSLLDELISRFYYMDDDDYQIRIGQIADHIIKMNYEPNETVIMAMAHDHEIDGSQDVLNALQIALLIKGFDGFSTDSRMDQKVEKNHYNKGIRNFVIVDDFVGTGRTAVKRYQSFVKTLNKNDIHVSFCIVSGMIGSGGQELSYTLGTQYIDLWSSSSLQGIAQTSLDSAPASFVTSLKQIA